MEITRLITAESTEEEYLFETEPALTEPVVTEFNAKLPPNLHLGERNGRLVVRASLVEEMKKSPFSSDNPADFLSEKLSEAEQRIQLEARRDNNAR